MWTVPNLKILLFLFQIIFPHKLVQFSITDIIFVTFSYSILILFLEPGLIKPNIIFFGEPLPGRFFDEAEFDCMFADLLICIGTSLEVYPFAGNEETRFNPFFLFLFLKWALASGVARVLPLVKRENLPIMYTLLSWFYFTRAENFRMVDIGIKA